MRPKEGFLMVGRRGGAVLAALAIAGASTGLAACGSDDEDGGGTAAEGGEIEIYQTSQPDFLDPALTYTVNGIEPLWLVYTPLLTYAHEEGEAGTELIPGLAEDLPEISEDGLTYELTLREGLKYADGTDVVASDFEHTIKRVLFLESGGSAFYEQIDGAAEYIDAGEENGDISGIETDDKTGEITITLTEPYAAFSQVLAMWFAGLVPGDTAFEPLTKEPPPGVGPYTITESVPNKQFVMEKNPEFEALEIPDIPVGNIDKITTSFASESKQTQDVLSGDADYMQDPPPPDLIPTVREEAADRYEEFASPSTYYWFLNTRTPPFDDPQVRSAVNYGIDKPALARLYGGTMQPGCTFIPPGVPGYDEEYDTTGCPYGDPTQPPDLEQAQQILEDAGAVGEKVTVWGNNQDDSQPVAEAFADQLNDIGFDADVEIVDAAVYFQTIGNEKTAPQTGFSNWFMDFPHPLNMYFLVDPDAIQPTNNQNYGNVDDPEIKDRLTELEQETDLESVADQWAELDKYLIDPEQSYIAPYGHRLTTKFLSERMDYDVAEFHPVYFNDYSSWALKEGEE